jgi:hypothetical protein
MKYDKHASKYDKYAMWTFYGKYARKYAKYAKNADHYATMRKTCKICTPHLADGRGPAARLSRPGQLPQFLLVTRLRRDAAPA